MILAKNLLRIEVKIDSNKEFIDFYKVLKTKFERLETEIKLTLHSRRRNLIKRQKYCKDTLLFYEVKRAWAIYQLDTSQSKLCRKTYWDWGYDIKENRSAKQLNSNRKSFTQEYAIRLE